MSAVSVVSRYLSSRRNVVGCVAALGGVAATAAGWTGEFWPGAVAALYAAGAVATPPERVRLALDTTGPGAYEPQRVLSELRTLRSRISALAARDGSGEARLPREVADQALRICDLLDGVLARPAELRAAHRQAQTVHDVVALHLPRTLEAYVNIPRGFSLTSRAAARGDAATEVARQLDLLERGVREVSDAVHAGDADRFLAQGRLLEAEFGREDELRLEDPPPSS